MRILLFVALLLSGHYAQASWLNGEPEAPPIQAVPGIPTGSVLSGMGDFTMLSRLPGDTEGEYQPSRITDYVYIIRDEATGEEYLYLKVEGGQRIVVHREKRCKP